MRRKSLIAVLTAMLLMFNAGMAMAAPPTSGPVAALRLGADDMMIVDFFMEPQNVTQVCEDRLHEIFALETTTLELRLEETELRDSILSKMVSAYDNDYDSCIENARELQRDAATITREIRDLNARILTEWQGFHEDAIAENSTGAENHLDNIISLKTQVNDKLEDKLDILEDAKTALTPL